MTLLLFLTSGCTLPIFPDKDRDLQPYLEEGPLVANNCFSINRLPAGIDGQQLLDQVTMIWKALHLWLAVPFPDAPVQILVFSPDEPAGKQFFFRRSSRHQAAGYYSHDSRVMVVTGAADDPGLFTVLRHEAAHAVLHYAFPQEVDIPFWVNEGVASLFEQGVRGDLIPAANSERLAYIRYMLENNEKLDFASLLASPQKKIRSAEAYARCWGMVSCLYQTKRSVGSYLNRLKEQQEDSQELFLQYLLTSGESVDDFEMSCSSLFSTANNRAEE